MNQFLTPTTSQKSAWQLLGYKRYILRSDIRAFHEQQLLTKLAVVEEALESNINTKRSSLIEMNAILQQEVLSSVEQKVELKESAQSQNVEDIEIFALSQCSVLIEQSIQIAFILPALYYQKEWQLFENQKERLLLQQALERCHYPRSAALFAKIENWRSAHAPKGDGLQYSLPVQHWIALGNSALQEIGATLFGTHGWQITHPALALNSAIYKQQLWLDLLKLRGILS